MEGSTVQRTHIPTIDGDGLELVRNDHLGKSQAFCGSGSYYYIVNLALEHALLLRVYENAEIWKRLDDEYHEHGPDMNRGKARHSSWLAFGAALQTYRTHKERKSGPDLPDLPGQ